MLRIDYLNEKIEAIEKAISGAKSGSVGEAYVEHLKYLRKAYSAELRKAMHRRELMPKVHKL